MGIKNTRLRVGRNHRQSLSRAVLRHAVSHFEPLEQRAMLSSTVPVAPPAGSVKLAGNLIGTAGSYQNKGNTIANAMDGNLNSFFDAPAGVQGWMGLDLGTPAEITQVQFVPRSGFDSRMVGGIFQGSTTPDFSSGVTNLFTVTASPAGGVYTAEPVSVTTSFEYVRYLSPVSGSGNVAEIAFDGIAGSSQPTTPVPPVVPVVPPPPVIPVAPAPPVVPVAPVLPPAPLTPTALTATAVSATQVQLSWQQDAASVVSSYTIERQGPTDANFVVIGTTTGSVFTFNDTNVLSATTYSYEVIATNTGGSSTPTAAATATTLSAPANPWSDSDIGAVGLPGSAVTNTNGSITVTGSGADIWNTADAFNFDSQPMSGNGTVITQVTAQTNDSTWAKAGIMMRETLNSDSRYVLLALTPGNGITMQARTATHVTPTISITVPGKTGVWLELVRDGSTFTGYSSTDGKTWTLVGSVTIDMINNIQTGLAVTAHNNTTVCKATFSNIAITPAGTEASQWSAGAVAPMPRWESETFTYNNEMYVFGGYIDRTLDATTECDVYNPATNVWSEVTTMPMGALTHAAVTVVGDTAYFAGGNIGSFGNSKSGVATNEVATFDLTTGQWGSVTSLPAAVTSEGLVCINNELISYGGINAASTVDQSATWSLNLGSANATWVAEAAMPDARNHIGYTEINGIAYAIGGTHLYNQTGGNDSQVDAYNPVTNTWAAVASLPFAWGGTHGTTLVVNGKIVIIGGQTNGGYDGIYLNNIEEYDPVANSWAAVGTLPEANQGQSVAYINGELIVADGTVDNQGGWAQDQTFLDSEIIL
jgi:N-acetylneuraminic acid mutarotase